jgi:hypothetical protein
MAKKKQYEIVEVTWIDAEELGEVGWNNLKEQQKNARSACPTIRSVGYVLYKDKNHISLVSSLSDTICGTVEKIPFNFILGVQTLVHSKAVPVTR